MKQIGFLLLGIVLVMAGCVSNEAGYGGREKPSGPIFAASTYTPNLNLEKPADGDPDWGEGALNPNFDTLDIAAGFQVNVLYYGATGGGIIDDTLAIQSAIDACPVGGTVFFPSGTYLCDALTVSTESITLAGKGTLKVRTAGTLLLTIAADSVTVSGLVFEGTETKSTTEILIYVEGAYHDGIIENCDISGATYGIRLGGASLATSPQRWMLTKNNIHNIVGTDGESEGYGILLVRVAHIVVSHNQLLTIQRHAIYLSAGTRYCIITENTIYDTEGNAIQLGASVTQDATSNNIISNNTIRDTSVSDDGISVSQKCDENLIQGNTFIPPMSVGIWVEGEADADGPYPTANVLQANSFVGTFAEAPIHVVAGDGTMIVGNSGDITSQTSVEAAIKVSIAAVCSLSLGTGTVANNTFWLDSGSNGIRVAVNDKTLYVRGNEFPNLDGAKEEISIGNGTVVGENPLSNGDTEFLGGVTASDIDVTTSAKLPSSATPTTDATGEIALDTTITDHQPLWQYYDGAENMTVIAIDTAELPALDNEIVKYNAITDKFVLEADAGGGGGNDVYVEEGDAARVDSSGADLYIDFLNADFDVGVVGNEGNVSVAAVIARDAEVPGLETDASVDTSAEIVAILNAGVAVDLEHEIGGLEADVSAYAGLVKITGGATSAVTVTAAGEAILDDANAAAQRTTLGVAIGSNVQGWDADLDDLADGTLSATAIEDKFLRNDGADTTSGVITSAGITITTTNPLTFGVVQWDDGSDQIDGEQIADDTIDDDSIDWADVTFADFTEQTAWRVFYSDTNGDVTELALGADGTFLKSNGAAVAPTFAVPGGAGDITAVGDVATADAFTADGEGNNLYFEGSSADAVETILTADDPTVGDGQAIIPDLESYAYYIVMDQTEVLDLEGTALSIAAGVLNVTEADPLVDTSAEIIAILNAGAAATLEHEIGGIEADVSVWTGILAVAGGVTTEVDLKSEVEAQLTDVADLAEADGDTWTGVHDAGGATSFELPNAAAPATATTGEIALDTTIVDHQPLWQYYDGGENMTVIAIDTAELPALDNEIVKYDAGTDKFVLEADAGGGAGATYREYTFLPESAVLDDTSPPAIAIVESTGTGTPRFRVAAFDAAADEIIYFTFVLPSDYTASSSPVIDYYWFANDVGPNEGVAWATQVSCTTEADADAMTEQAADADILIVTEDVNETEANRLMLTSGTLTYATYMDGGAAGDVITIRISRDVSDAADDLTSDARLHSIHLKIPRN